MAMSDYNPFGDFHSSMLSADPFSAYMGAAARSKPRTDPGQGYFTQPWQNLAPEQRYDFDTKRYTPTTASGNIARDRAMDYLSGQYQDFRNRFAARRGQELYEKKDPATLTTFEDFIGQETDPAQGGTPFTERYARQTPYTKGTSQSKFSPSTRFIFY